MKNLLILLFTSVFVFNCSDDESSSNVRIRLSNDSQFTYKNIIVNTSEGNVIFEDISPGDRSDYKTFEIAYRYAFVQLEIDGTLYTYQPIDYVGETPLDNGNYTYQLGVTGNSDLSLNLVID